jgi:outer membrane protein OmpA-like peptidoglycan-associated protein
LFYCPFSYAQNIEFVEENFRNEPERFEKAVIAFTEGIAYYDQSMYKNALDFFLEANAFNPNNSELNFLIGSSYLNSIYKEKALDYLLKSYKLDPDYSYLTHSLIAQAYQYNYRFKQAKTSYYKFKVLLPVDSLKVWNTWLTKKIEECNSGMELMLNPSSGLIINQKDINSDASDYAPVISADGNTIFFTSRRDREIDTEVDPYDNEPYEDIYYSTKLGYKWLEPKNIGEPINTKYHDATVGVSPDGNELYIYRGSVNGGDIFVSYKNDSLWTKPVPLSSEINTKGQENSASISSDNKTLYFISDRPGGYGGKDIYIAKRDSNNAWTNVKNLGSVINSEYDEDGVFITPSQDVIYFSSNGPGTMGGYDIFYSIRVNDSVWSEPRNMGYPINSPDDDIFFFVTADGKQGFYSSIRTGGKGRKDNYMINFSENEEGNEVYLAPNSILGCENQCKQSSCVTLNVSFFEDKKAENFKYEWILGDGSVKYGDKISHCYQHTGKYTVVLNAINMQGIKTENVESTEINIGGKEIGRAVIESKDYVLVGTEVEFDASNSAYSEGQVTRYQWRLPDGSTDHLVNTTYKFNEVGEYKVDLKILAENEYVDSCCYAKSSKYILVFENKEVLQKHLMKVKDSLIFDRKFENIPPGLYNFTCKAVDSITGIPIPNVHITLKSKQDTFEFNDITNKEGIADFILDNSKNYQINLKNIDYKTKNYSHTTRHKNEFELRKATIELVKQEGYLFTGRVKNKANLKSIDDVDIIVSVNNNSINDEKSDNEGKFEFVIEELSDSLHFNVKLFKEGYVTIQYPFSISTDRKRQFDLNSIVDLVMEEDYVSGTILHPIYYGFDKSDVNQIAAQNLDEIVRFMIDNPSAQIEVNSYTDCQGAEDYNMILSENRVNSSIDYIVSKGIDRSRLIGRAFGEAKPIFDCGCEETSTTKCSVAQNKLTRRTEFVIIKM